MQEHTDDGSFDWPAATHEVLRALGVSQVGYVPDAGHRRLIELCQADPAMRAVPLTTEEEGIGLAAGAWLGGARAVLLMQSSGVGNCPNTLAMTKACGFPFLALVTMRGEWGEFNPWQVTMGRATPAVLEAMGTIVLRADEAERIVETVRAGSVLAFDSGRMVAVLIGQRAIGAKVFRK